MIKWRVFAAGIGLAATLHSTKAAFAAGARPRTAELDLRRGACKLDGDSLPGAREQGPRRVPDLVRPLVDHEVSRLRLRVDGRTTSGVLLDVLDQLKKTRVVSWELFINQKRIGRFPNRSCGHHSIDAGVNDLVATDLSVRIVLNSAGAELYCLSSGP